MVPASCLTNDPRICTGITVGGHIRRRVGSRAASCPVSRIFRVVPSLTTPPSALREILERRGNDSCQIINSRARGAKEVSLGYHGYVSSPDCLAIYLPRLAKGFVGRATDISMPNCNRTRSDVILPYCILHRKLLVRQQTKNHPEQKERVVLVGSPRISIL